MILSSCLAILIFGQSHSAKFRFVLYGDCRDGYDMHKKIVALTMKQRPSFVIQTGDLVGSGTSARQWKLYDEITGEMRKSVPLYPAPGNHDVGGTFYEDRVTSPIESGNKQYYCFTYGRWHFVSLAIELHTAYGAKSPQYAWLEGDLKSARAKKQDIAVFFHVPPYSIGGHGSDLDVRAALCPLFARYGVSLVMNGHDHLYYRTVRGGITYVVSGGGGAPIYPALMNKGQIPGDKWLADNHIVVFDADGGKLTAWALKPDGTTFDRFTVDGRR